MTNKDAIEFLKNMISQEGGRAIGASDFMLELCGYHVTALRMGIKALEQEPKTGHWIMRHRKVNTINYRTGEDVLTGEIHTVKELIRYETDEPYCAGCGKRAEDISQGYCGYCGAKMDEPQERSE